LANQPLIDGFSDFDLDLDKAILLIKQSGAKIVGLQVPEGLKRAAFAISRQIKEQTGAEVIVSGDPCYGACDVDMALCDEVDIMLHLGHAELGEGPENVIFLEARMISDIKKTVEKVISHLQSKNVGITSTVQHVHKLNEAIDILRDHGIDGVVGPATGRIKYPGQVLGCCYSSATSLSVDEFLFVGTGQFHPLGISLSTGKRVITADPITGEISEVDPSSILRRRFGAISRAMDAKKFGILLSKKPGQKRMNLAVRLKELGLAMGKEMILVHIDNIEPDRFLNLGIDAAVSTACPRIALDDSAKYKIPVLTPIEFEIMLGKRQWDEYSFDEIEN
jgi:2-(3-amino-3-carboxypropyl)histidine synthase